MRCYRDKPRGPTLGQSARDWLAKADAATADGNTGEATECLRQAQSLANQSNEAGAPELRRQIAAAIQRMARYHLAYRTVGGELLWLNNMTADWSPMRSGAHEFSTQVEAVFMAQVVRIRDGAPCRAIAAPNSLPENDSYAIVEAQ